MTATEHAEAILMAMRDAIGVDGLTPVPAILAAVQAAMQDARAEERARIVGWMQADNEKCDCFAYDESECGCGGWYSHKMVSMGTIADRIEALAHKGAGDE